MVFQNLVMLYSINNKTDTQVIKKYMSMVGLDPDDTKKVKNNSMGMKQTLGYCAGYYGISTIINFG